MGHSDEPNPISSLAARIRAEFSPAPGHQLAIEQASRFMGVEPRSCRHALRELENAGFLGRSSCGRYQQVTCLDSAGMGRFSSDRDVLECATSIVAVPPVRR
jgi:predicted transcriptional regulator of viral defense system